MSDRPYLHLTCGNLAPGNVYRALALLRRKEVVLHSADAYSVGPLHDIDQGAHERERWWEGVLRKRLVLLRTGTPWPRSTTAQRGQSAGSGSAISARRRSVCSRCTQSTRILLNVLPHAPVGDSFLAWRLRRMLEAGTLEGRGAGLFGMADELRLKG